MKKNILKLSTFLLIVGFLFVVGCSKNDDDGSSDKNKNNVSDPEGTITSNIAEGTEIILLKDISYCAVSWAKPDNIWISYGDYDCYYCLISICSVGQVNGLGSINRIPTSGYTSRISGDGDQTLSCDVGYGYVIKIEEEVYYPYTYTIRTYARMYVIERIISTSGGIMGAKVKYQYPFEP